MSWASSGSSSRRIRGRLSWAISGNSSRRICGRLSWASSGRLSWARLDVEGDRDGLAVGLAVVCELLGLEDGLALGLSVGHGASNLMLLMWINWANPF